MGNYWIKLLAGFVLITALPVYWLAVELRATESSHVPAASRGILDLREWRFDADGAVRLNGQWDMYVGKVLGASELAASSDSLRPIAATVPGVWNGSPGLESGRGAATYRLRLLLPPDARGTFGIRMMNIRTASRIFVNGEQIGVSGLPGETRSATHPGNVPFAGYFTLTASAADIVVQVANFSYASGGIVLPIWFGRQEAIQSDRETGLFEYWLTAGGFFGARAVFSAVLPPSSPRSAFAAYRRLLPVQSRLRADARREACACPSSPNFVRRRASRPIDLLEFHLLFSGPICRPVIPEVRRSPA
ncbi:hypothetical protein [Cohnella rhizosphaerae]|uniref:Glycosyl hydrolases family 2 sugar binding domain-containing protein n=1 Tax=Cohnella rhizosphaerae TaxID=1457232 RepID=A0A9X4L079_9BACL|nr:hypothetical protein [Cohnella rhizosphaerae]MDG0814455.1 hypothetical protein [Cohnella rhizosphaerae]